MSFTGRGVADGYLTSAEAVALATDGLAHLPLDGRRVLVLIPDGTRTMPMPLLFETLDRTLAGRVAALDFLVALGTHTPMSDEQLSAHLGRPVAGGRAGDRRVFNHRWDDPRTFAALGTIPAQEIADLTGGRLREDVPVALNRLVTEYDHVLICGPVFPHEVVGFSGGTKYLFPGIAAPPIIHFTHWLGALITSSEVLGTADTPVRAVIDRAAALLDTPLSLLAVVVTHQGIAGVFCGDPRETWRQAAALSARRHIVWLDHPVDRVLAVMPPMYADLWTAGKGVYKTEPVVADGGEVVVLAPHVREVSLVHGRMIEEIGYHCRDYFLGQWDRFKGFPGGILAHSTHVRGLGTYDAASRAEACRIRVTLATGIAEDRCERINLGYRDPAGVEPRDWPDGNGSLVVPRAGEMLYRVGRAPAPA
ncbi:MAG TPA: lactate racemase domain-containing protein [Vicinamibacterales bacterium]|nr:lactate racemase domain-containing protein [Vicinamibacterales bacterium]